MEISQLKQIAQITKNKKIIAKLLDVDEQIIQDIINQINGIIDELKVNNIKYPTEELEQLIDEILLGEKYGTGAYYNSVCKLVRDITNKRQQENKDINMNIILKMLKLFREEEYSPLVLDVIRKFKPILSDEDFYKLFEALKSRNFEVSIGKYSFIHNLVAQHKDKKIFKTRTMDEICKMIKEDNGLTPVQINEIYFDKDMLNHRTYEESKALGDKIIEAYKSATYKEKVQESKKLQEDDIEQLAIDSKLLAYMSCEEQLKLMDIFIKNPSDKLYKMLTNSFFIQCRKFDEIVLLIKEYQDNPNNYCLIINCKLLLLPIENQIEYIKFLSTINSPFIKDQIINSERALSKEELEELREKDKATTVEEELQNAKDVDEFINSLVENNITTFDSKTKIYTKKAIKPKE